MAAPGWAERVRVPLSLEAAQLEALVRERMFGGGELRISDDGTGCQYLRLEDPRVRVQGSQLLLTVRAAARAGRAVGDRCLLGMDWGGEVELIQRPVLSQGGEGIILHTDHWRALRPDGSTDPVSTGVGRWLEQFLPATLTELHIDLVEPLTALRDFLAATAVPAALDAGSIALDEVQVTGGGVRLTLGVDAPSAVAPAGPVEPALSAAELAVLEERLQALDGFFTQVIRALDDVPLNAQALFEVLIELRQEVVAILAAPASHADEPVRRLFISAWRQLVPLLRDAAAAQGGSEQALHYLAFIGAGDALAALDALGPAVGVDISVDGLRRLARLLLPAEPELLQHSEAVDPELRRVLGLGEPLPPPRQLDTQSWIDTGLRMLVPAVVANPGLDTALVTRLNNWVPRPPEMASYLPMVRDVLQHVVVEQLQSGELDADYRQLFRWLVFAAAWQESCWRQFVAENQMRVPLRSASGDLGIMQINPTVWRGLYDLHGLRWDIVYNARAGADILEHYLVSYALRHGEHETTGSVDSLARSTYAAYNGGPRRFARYREDDIPADTLFYEKYREVKQHELAVTACYPGL